MGPATSWTLWFALLVLAVPLTGAFGYFLPALFSTFCLDFIDGCGDYSIWMAYRDLWTYSIIADVVFVAGVLLAVIGGWLWHRQRAWRDAPVLLSAIAFHAAALVVLFAGLVATGYWVDDSSNPTAWPPWFVFIFTVVAIWSASLGLLASTACLVGMIRLQPGPYVD